MLQSASILVHAIVVKDPATGQLHTRENEVLGPIAYIETTTSLRLNPENTSRCFEIPLDESPEQTRRIHQRQKALKRSVIRVRKISLTPPEGWGAEGRLHYRRFEAQLQREVRCSPRADPAEPSGPEQHGHLY